MWDRACPGSAARAAHGLKGAGYLQPCTWRPSYGSMPEKQGGRGNPPDITGPKQTWEQSLLAKRRAGGARSQGRRRNPSHAPGGPDPIPSQTTRRTRQWHRHNWPETDVGAELAREAPRGRRSISRTLEASRHALGGLYKVPSGEPFDLKDNFPKLTLDAPTDLSIIRPTSGADQTENSLIIKQLTKVARSEVFRSERRKR